MPIAIINKSEVDKIDNWHAMVFVKAENLLKEINEDLNLLNIKLLIEKNVNILKSGSYANVCEVEYKLVYNPIKDKFNDENGWNKLESSDDLPKIDSHDYYVLEDEEKSILLRKQLTDSRDRIKKDGEIKAKANAEKAAIKKESKKLATKTIE